MIRLAESTFFNEELTTSKLCNFIKSTSRHSMGEQCLRFEQSFADYQGRKFAAFFNSGSSANLVLIQALINMGSLKRGDKVGFSALTWPTNVMPIIQLGLSPVPIDVSIDTMSISSARLSETVHQHNLKALFYTNPLGFCGDLDRVAEICKDNDIIFLEDNCESLGSEYKQKKLGNFGLASTFSFFVGHHFSTIEGGMICTDDERLRDMIVMVRSHGWTRNLDATKQQEFQQQHSISSFLDRFSFYALAYNVRPMEISGFLGAEQMPDLPLMVQRRAENYARFQAAAKTNSDIHPLNLDHMDIVSNFAFPVICKTKELFQKYLDVFRRHDVEIRPVIGGSIVEQPFFKELVGTHFTCETAKTIHETGFYFPNRADLSEDEVQLLVRLVGGTHGD